MAEENPIETENNEEAQINESELDEIEIDDVQDEVAETEGSNRLNQIKEKLSVILSNRRNLVIIGVAIGVIVISTIGYKLLSKEKPQQNAAALNQQEAPSFNSSNIVKKKEKKKKRKKIKYVDLYKQLDGDQIAPILRELSYLNIIYNVIQNGKQYDLQVDQEQLNEAKNILAIKGMPSEKAIGYEIFDEASNLGVTEFDKRIRLVRALSGEMEKAIMEFDAIDYAHVEIVIPETKLFAVTQPPVTSSILIKRTNGVEITDETVFAILQLVSNSVESLDKENISVVDTEGRVLSTGVVDRVQQKIKSSQEKDAKISSRRQIGSVGKGKVIIPEIEDVVDWFQLKYNYETVLEKKAHNQLNGVLPIGSYKTAVTIDLSSVTKTGAPNIKKIITSVVVDEQFDEVELNEETVNQIKQAIAGAVGYEDGRDHIHISKAGFLPKQRSVVESLDEDQRKKVVLPKESFFVKIKKVLRLWPIFFIGLLATTGIVVIYKLVLAVVGNTISSVKNIVKSMASWVPKRKEKVKEEPLPEDIITEEIPAEPEMSEQEVLNALKTKSDFSKVIQLKAMATQDIELVVQELKELIKG